MYDIPTAQKPVEEENKLPEICRLHGLFESLEHELDSIQIDRCKDIGQDTLTRSHTVDSDDGIANEINHVPVSSMSDFHLVPGIEAYISPRVNRKVLHNNENNIFNFTELNTPQLSNKNDDGVVNSSGFTPMSIYQIMKMETPQSRAVDEILGELENLMGCDNSFCTSPHNNTMSSVIDSIPIGFLGIAEQMNNDDCNSVDYEKVVAADDRCINNSQQQPDLQQPVMDSTIKNIDSEQENNKLEDAMIQVHNVNHSSSSTSASSSCYFESPFSIDEEQAEGRRNENTCDTDSLSSPISSATNTGTGGMLSPPMDAVSTLAGLVTASASSASSSLWVSTPPAEKRRRKRFESKYGSKSSDAYKYDVRYQLTVDQFKRNWHNEQDDDDDESDNNSDVEGDDSKEVCDEMLIERKRCKEDDNDDAKEENNKDRISVIDTDSCSQTTSIIYQHQTADNIRTIAKIQSAVSDDENETKDTEIAPSNDSNSSSSSNPVRRIISSMTSLTEEDINDVDSINNNSSNNGSDYGIITASAVAITTTTTNEASSHTSTVESLTNDIPTVTAYCTNDIDYPLSKGIIGVNKSSANYDNNNSNDNSSYSLSESKYHETDHIIINEHLTPEAHKLVNDARLHGDFCIWSGGAKLRVSEMLKAYVGLQATALTHNNEHGMLVLASPINNTAAATTAIAASGSNNNGETDCDNNSNNENRRRLRAGSFLSATAATQDLHNSNNKQNGGGSNSSNSCYYCPYANTGPSILSREEMDEAMGISNISGIVGDEEDDSLQQQQRQVSDNSHPNNISSTSLNCEQQQQLIDSSLRRKRDSVEEDDDDDDKKDSSNNKKYHLCANKESDDDHHHINLRSDYKSQSSTGTTNTANSSETSSTTTTTTTKTTTIHSIDSLRCSSNATKNTTTLKATTTSGSSSSRSGSSNSNGYFAVHVLECVVRPDIEVGALLGCVVHVVRMCNYRYRLPHDNHITVSSTTTASFTTTTAGAAAGGGRNSSSPHCSSALYAVNSGSNRSSMVSPAVEQIRNSSHVDNSKRKDITTTTTTTSVDNEDGAKVTTTHDHHEHIHQQMTPTAPMGKENTFADSSSSSSSTGEEGNDEEDDTVHTTSTTISGVSSLTFCAATDGDSYSSSSSRSNITGSSGSSSTISCDRREMEHDNDDSSSSSSREAFNRAFAARPSKLKHLPPGSERNPGLIEFDLIDIQVVVSKELRQRVILCQFLRRVPNLSSASTMAMGGLGGLLLHQLTGGHTPIPLEQAFRTRAFISKLKRELTAAKMCLSSLYTAPLRTVCALPYAHGIDALFRAQLYHMLRRAMLLHLDDSIKQMAEHLQQHLTASIEFVKFIEPVFKLYNVPLPALWTTSDNNYNTNNEQNRVGISKASTNAEKNVNNLTEITGGSSTANKTDRKKPFGSTAATITNHDDNDGDSELKERSHEPKPRPHSSSSSSNIKKNINSSEISNTTTNITSSVTATTRKSSSLSLPRDPRNVYEKELLQLTKVDGMTFCLIQLDQCFQELQKRCDNEYSRRVQDQNQWIVRQVESIQQYKKDILHKLVNSKQAQESSLLKVFISTFSGIRDAGINITTTNSINASFATTDTNNSNSTEIVSTPPINSSNNNDNKISANSTVDNSSSTASSGWMSSFTSVFGFGGAAAASPSSSFYVSSSSNNSNNFNTGNSHNSKSSNSNSNTYDDNISFYHTEAGVGMSTIPTAAATSKIKLSSSSSTAAAAAAPDTLSPFIPRELRPKQSAEDVRQRMNQYALQIAAAESEEDGTATDVTSSSIANAVESSRVDNNIKNTDPVVVEIATTTMSQSTSGDNPSMLVPVVQEKEEEGEREERNSTFSGNNSNSEATSTPAVVAVPLAVVYYCSCLVSNTPGTLYITTTSICAVSSMLLNLRQQKDVFPLSALQTISTTPHSSSSATATTLASSRAPPSSSSFSLLSSNTLYLGFYTGVNYKELIISPMMVDSQKLRLMILQIKSTFVLS